MENINKNYNIFLYLIAKKKLFFFVATTNHFLNIITNSSFYHRKCEKKQIKILMVHLFRLSHRMMGERKIIDFLLR